MILFANQKQRNRDTENKYMDNKGKEGWEELGYWYWNISDTLIHTTYDTMYKLDNNENIMYSMKKPLLNALR